MIDSARVQTLTQKLHQAASAGKLTATAVTNITAWLTEQRYAEFAGQVAEHIDREDWKTLDSVFWTTIPFGTGGRRGAMYPIGTNAINDRTIGESAQGLADYVKQEVTKSDGQPLKCAIAYDTRHRSRYFAELCAEIMVANGFKVYFLDGYRSTPELSFAVRLHVCDCGIMVTASHNPPSDNAVKVYWSTGGQVLPPHDKGVIDRVMNTQQIDRQPFATALSQGRVVYCQEATDAAYHQAVLAQSLGGPRDLKILYSPMHGVGGHSVSQVFKAAGFANTEVYGPHAKPDGDFPNVPGHVANPENPATFDGPIAHAEKSGAELVLSNDPDADRLGCAARLAKGQPFATFTGNQLGVLLADYVLEQRKKAGRLGPKDYLAITLVTTPMIARIAETYGARVIDNLQVGFKWIAGLMDQEGPEHFVLGAEESHGYLVGHYARDKDGIVAAMLLAELAALEKSRGKTLHQKLESLYWQHGYHAELTVSQGMPGSQGMARMKEVMAALRQSPPQQLGGMPVRQVRDYGTGTLRIGDGPPQPLAGTRGDLVMLDLAARGNCVAVRPSGTEPKIKFYLFACQAPELMADLELTRSELTARLGAFEQDLKALVSRGPSS